MSTSEKPATDAAPAPERPPADAFEHKKCMERLELTISTNKYAQKVLDGITDLGCALPADFFVCRPCENDMFGGFMTPHKNADPKIIMCENKSVDKQMYQTTVVHELIHAYDVCRAKLDPKNCKHRACTEIRASSLSGECNILRELHRGRFVFNKGHQECVKRRATLSLGAMKSCKKYCAEDVEEAFNDCYNDTSPFEMHT